MRQFLFTATTFAIALLAVFVIVTGADAGPKRFNVVYTDWFPYTYTEKGKARGFELEIFQAVAAEMRIQAAYDSYPWKRCLLLLETGQADALVSMMKTCDRETYTDYPAEHISISQSVFFTQAGSAIAYNGNLEAMKNFNIGLIMGFSYGDAFDRADFLEKDPSPNTTILIKKLLAGRHPVAAENESVVSGYARKMGISDRIRILRPPIETERLYVGFSKTRHLQKLVERFSTALAEFKTSGAYQVILNKYGVTASQVEPEAQ